MERNEIMKIYGEDPREMTIRLLTASKLQERIPAGARVGIKPNLVSPTPAQYGATTHPEVVAGIIEYLKAHGVEKICIMEGSWIGDKTSEAYEYCGYRELSERYGVPLLDAQKERSHVVDCAGLELKICDCADTVDFMINVPVLKGHGQTRITCALKNMKGLIPNSEKRHFHTMGLHRPIAHLAKGIRQDFIVVDHICGDLELEDGGNPIEANCVMTCLDPVLCDAYVCRILGYETADVPYIGMAEELGAGSSDLASAKISVWKEDGTAVIYNGLEKDPDEVWRDPSKALLEISYAIEDADSCSACYASLAPAILRLKEEGLWERIEERLPGKIAIGQGFAGMTGEIGVGRCCSGFRIHVPGCPPEEEDVYRMLRDFLEKGEKS